MKVIADSHLIVLAMRLNGWFAFAVFSSLQYALLITSYSQQPGMSFYSDGNCV